MFVPRDPCLLVLPDCNQVASLYHNLNTLQLQISRSIVRVLAALQATTIGIGSPQPKKVETGTIINKFGITATVRARGSGRLFP